MDNLVIQIKHRTPDVTGRIPVRALYSDRNFVTLQGGIQDRSHYLDSPGLISDPGLCLSGLTISFNDFVCFAPGGILCNIPSGSVGLTPANSLFDRIDLVTVDPMVQYDADGEINYSGEVKIEAGLTDISGLTPYANGLTPCVQMPPCSLVELKIGEIDVPAGISEPVLRGWTPNYVKESGLKPYAQDPPRMTININPWQGFVGTCCNPTVYRGGIAPFSLPGDCCIHRLDLVSLTPGGTIRVTAGLSVASPSEAVSPSLISGEIPIAQVYVFGEQEYISQAEIIDIRPFITGYSCI